MVSVFYSTPASAQNTWMNPYTGNSFNNPMSSALDTSIMNSMQRRLTQSQLLGTLPSQQGRASNTNLFEQYQHGMPDRPMNAQPSWSSYPQYSNLPPPAGAPPPPPLPTSGSAPAPRPASTAAASMPAPALQHFPMTATNFKSGPRTLPAVYAAQGPKENQAQLLQTFNAMMDAFEKEAGKYNVANAIAFLIGVSAQVHTGREIADPVIEKFAQDLNDILAGSPSFQALPPNKKQELYESSVLTGAMIGGLATSPETKADSKALAKQVLQSLGAIN
jgi:hypothetical protein